MHLCFCLKTFFTHRLEHMKYHVPREQSPFSVFRLIKISLTIRDVCRTDMKVRDSPPKQESTRFIEYEAWNFLPFPQCVKACHELFKSNAHINNYLLFHNKSTVFNRLSHIV